ncbi:MAG: FAD-dependent oxidoreductase [Paenibacillus sp.]|nr:FAD-dependent oxidoreductase [Paenibacillus sp.]
MIVHRSSLPTGSLGHYDAAVIGGGFAGIAAAAAMARSGAKVALLEPTGTLGREMVRSRNIFLDVPKHTATSKAMKQFEEALVNRKGLFAGAVDPNCAALAFDDMMEAMGVEVWFHTCPAELLLTEGNVTGLRVATRSGYASLTCARVIDASVSAKTARQLDQAVSLPVQRDTATLHVLFNETDLVERQETTVALPAHLGSEAVITARPTYWPKEADVAIRFQGLSEPASRGELLLELEPVLDELRRFIPDVCSGVLSHIADELWALPPFTISGGDESSGLIGAGLWLHGLPAAAWSEEETLANLFVLGEAAAEKACAKPGTVLKK